MMVENSIRNYPRHCVKYLMVAVPMAASALETRPAAAAEKVQ